MAIRTITIDDSQLTDSDINEIVGIAGYGGISYWGGIDPCGGDYTVEEHETERTFLISCDNIRDAYFKLLDFDQRYVAKYLREYIINSWQGRDSNGIDTGYIDAEAADVIIQIAVFDELVYG